MVLVRIPTQTSILWRIGLTDGTSFTNFAGFVFDTNTSTTDVIYGNISGGSATQLTATMATANTWVRFEFAKSGSSVTYKMNGTTLGGAAITTNIPTAALTPIFQIQTRTGSTRSLDVDLCWIKGTVSR